MTSNTFRFYVTGDPHFSDTPDSQYSNISNMVTHIKSSADFREHKFLFLLGDMTSTTQKKQLECYKEVFTSNFDMNCILCDGLGNHDMYRNRFKHNYKNMYKFIQYRNTLRKSYMPLNTDTKMSMDVAGTKKSDGNGLHYHITVDAIGTKLHFINLNLLPIDANKKTVDTQYIYGNNALIYLRLQLKQIPKAEPVFIFSHIGFITLGKWGPDKYWNEQEREEFLNSLDSHTIGGIFCGHVHTTGMIDSFGSENVPEKYNKMLKEHQLYHQCVLAGGATKQSYVDVAVSMENGLCKTTVDKIEAVKNSKDYKTTRMATISARAPIKKGNREIKSPLM